MSSEREKIKQIRSEVNQYDRYQQLYGGTEATIGVLSDTTEPRVVLCSQVGPCVTAGGYSIILSEDLGIKNFATGLHDLFQGRMHSNAKFGQVANFTCYYFCLVSLILQVKMYSACRVSHLCQVTGDLEKEIFHATSTWQGSGPRYDSVIIQGQQRSSLFFAEVCALFSVSVGGEAVGVAIAKTFTRKPRN